MRVMDHDLINCPEPWLPDDLSEYMDDENLDKILDPDIFLSDFFPTLEADIESFSEVPAVTDCLFDGSLENATSNTQCPQKHPIDNGDESHTASRPKRQKTLQDDPGWILEKVFPPSYPEITPVQPPSSPLPSPPACTFTIRTTVKSQLVPTINLPPFLGLSHAAARTIILVPVTRHPKFSPAPLSPVNGAAAPGHRSSSPSGSLSDSAPACESPRPVETSPVKESRACPSMDIPQSVKDYIQETKAYISQACDDLGDGLTFNSNYVDSKVLQHDNVNSGKMNKSLDKELEVMGETNRKKCMVAVNEIFEQHHGSHSKAYNLLVGKAGMGKTTCIKKLCLDWSKNSIPQFDFIFLLDGRLLNLAEPTYSVQTLLLSLSSFASPCSDQDAVFAQILSSPKRVLLIFDGFEDLRDFEQLVQPLEKDVAACLQKDKKANTFTVRQLYSAILSRVVLPGCSLLLVSRPRGSASLLLRKVDRVLEVSGFSPSEVEAYVMRYFSCPDAQNSAINCLQKWSYLKLLCWNPCICQLVCSILQSQPCPETLPRTLTGICYEVLRMKLETAISKEEEEAQSSEQVVEKGDCKETQARRKSQVHTRKRATRKAHSKQSNANKTNNGLLSELSSLAWESVKANSSKITNDFSISSKTREVGLETGLLNCTLVGRRQTLSNTEKDKGDMDEKRTVAGRTTESEGVGGHECLTWTNPFLQSYLAAVHLSSSSAGLTKTLSFQLAYKGRRRSQREVFELTQRFAVGILFQNQSQLLWLHPTNKDFCNTVVNKQKAVMDHLRNLPLSHLRSSHILDLCHFVYEGSFANCGSPEASSFSQLAAHFVDNFPERLTFNGIPLSPADVCALKNIVDHRGEKKRSFTLDVEDSGIQVSGLRSLVGLEAIKTYRACIADVIALWEELDRQEEGILLHKAVYKLQIDPFKATQVRHIEQLAKLVDIHTTKRLSESRPNAILAEGVPAVKELHKLELVPGSEKVSLALPMLWEMLPGLHNLQHMDLEKNKVGDNEAKYFAEALISLSSLETLNLSSNSIGDHGAKALAFALRNLPRLERLSLHFNVISDEGACSLAAVLPQMAVLSELDIRYNKLTDVGAQSLGNSLKQCPRMKSLRFWNGYITSGVFERLKQLDYRITADT